MNKSDLNNIRREYQKGNLDIASVHSDPYTQFKIWMLEALQQIPDDPTEGNIDESGVGNSGYKIKRSLSGENFWVWAPHQSKYSEQSIIIGH